ncbi:MAG: sarcosine oxidase subunit gamma [Geminicoccaceae bacterium]
MPEIFQPIRAGALGEPASLRANTGALHLREVPHTGKILLRGDPADRAFMGAAGRALDLVLPTEPCTSSARSGVTALWLGPDEWLLVTEPGEAGAVLAKLDAARDPATSLAVDKSDEQTVIEVSGSVTRDLLAKGTPLDMHPRGFAVAQVKRTLFGRIDVIMHLKSEDEAGAVVDLYCRRSFAAYLWAFLRRAGREYGIPAAA